MNYTLINEENKKRILKKLNYNNNEERQNQLNKQLDELNKLGFYIELLPTIEPKFFVEKQGFSIKEALLLTRGEDQARPLDQEIQRLQFDHETNILKLEYENIAFKKKEDCTYILILGPPNRGKTTFIFNIINNIFNVQYNSMYRVKKKQVEAREYFDEYFIQISNKNYVVVDFRGIGDIKLDFLGLDQSGNSNLYITILEYLQNKSSIAAIFYVNSSSINRLSEDESYCLQRFFELIPNEIITQHKLFLVLTYCTDNQPKMTIYQQSNSTPKYLKILLSRQDIPDEEKFWYGINNKPLYEPVIYSDDQNQEINEKLQKLLINIGSEDDGNFLEPESNLNDGKQLGQEDQNENEDKREVEIEETQLGKFQYNLMTNVISEIIKKIKIQNNRNDNGRVNQITEFFKDKLIFEKTIIELLKVYRLSTQGLLIEKLEIKEFQTTYLAYEQKDLNEKETFQIKKGSKLLLCDTCQIKCHVNCRFRNTSEMNDQNMCRMFIKQQDGTFECKKCKKHDTNKKCQPKNHSLIDRAGEIPKRTLVSMIIQDNYQKIKDFMPLNKKQKALYRLQQTAAIKAKLNYQQQIDIIREQVQQGIKNQSIIDLNQRAKYLNAMITQLKNNNQNGDDFYKKLEEVNQIYLNFLNPQNDNNKINENAQQQQKPEMQQQQNPQIQQQQNPEIQQQQNPEIKQQQIDDSNISFQNQNNISFRQQSNEQNQRRQSIDESPQRNNLKNSAYFNIPNEQQPLISGQ